MLFSIIIFAAMLSFDSLGVGITYGIRNITLDNKSKFTIFIIAFFSSFLSTSIGTIVSNAMPDWFPSVLGSSLLICLGFWIIIQSFRKTNGIIEILKDPSISDFDNSNTIDSKESAYLGFAISADAFVGGFGLSMINGFSIVLPIFAGLFHLSFLIAGMIVGKKIKSISSISPAMWSRISGILLILFGLIKLAI